MTHKLAVDPAIIERLRQQRGGKLHIFDDIDPARTAHLIIDLQNGFMEPGAPVEVPAAREIVANVNAVSRALREAGGINVFVRFTTAVDALDNWSNFYGRLAPERRNAHQQAFAPGNHYRELWPQLDVAPNDLIVDKGRFGAFAHGTSDLHDILQARAIDTLIISGTVTNVCCETTAREAMQLNYKVIFLSDGNAAMSDADHNATLHNMYRTFADVMSTAEVVAILDRVAA